MSSLVTEVAVYVATPQGIALFKDPVGLDWGPLRTAQLGDSAQDTVLRMLGHELGLVEVDLPRIHQMSNAPPGLVCCVEYFDPQGVAKLSLVFLVCLDYDLVIPEVRFVFEADKAPRGTLPAMRESLLITLHALSKVKNG